MAVRTPKPPAEEAAEETTPPAEVKIDTTDPGFLGAIEAVVLKVLGGGTEEAPPVEDEPVAPTGRRSLRDEEDHTQRLVEKEVERIREFDKIRDDLVAIKEKVAEKPPGQMKKLTKAIWGDDK